MMCQQERDLSSLFFSGVNGFDLYGNEGFTHSHETSRDDNRIFGHPCGRGVRAQGRRWSCMSWEHGEW